MVEGSKPRSRLCIGKTCTCGNGMPLLSTITRKVGPASTWESVEDGMSCPLNPIDERSCW